jgi:hypothetical protein
VLKLLGASVAVWLSTVLVALVLFVVVAGASGKSVRSGEQAVVILLALTALEMLLAVAGVYVLGQRFVPEAGMRIVAVLLFAVVEMMSFAALGFLFLVGFNR